MTRLGTLFVLVALAVPAVAQAQCKPGDILIGEDDEQYVCRSKSSYEGSAAQRHGLKFCKQKLLVDADQAAIAALDFTLDAERFEEFGKVAAEKKAAFEKQVLNGLIDQALAGTELAAKSASSLNPYNVNNAADMLTRKGFGDPDLIAALRAIAHVKDKPAMAAKYHEFVLKLNGARRGWNTRTDIQKDPANANLRLIAGALKMVQGNPHLGLIVTGAEMGENLAYLYYLTGETNDLARSSDAKLARLDTLGGRLKAHVDTMSAAKKSWRASLGQSKAWPTCGD